LGKDLLCCVRHSPPRETEVEEWVKKYDDEMTAKDSEFHSETELYTQGAPTLRITNSQRGSSSTHVVPPTDNRAVLGLTAPCTLAWSQHPSWPMMRPSAIAAARWLLCLWGVGAALLECWVRNWPGSA
jgi:hypothetical protein